MSLVAVPETVNGIEISLPDILETVAVNVTSLDEFSSISSELNAKLTVGECIRLNFENITQDNKVEKELNEHRSGNYLIMHLCHSFTPNNSFTSLTLARDEYGVARKL